MRLRLRAPDEADAESGFTFRNSSSSTLYKPEHSSMLPPLDVCSPDYIEERLDNLKRRPNWRDYLDQYVQDYPDSDSEDERVVCQTFETPGFIHSTFWSLLVALLAPLLILYALCIRHQSYGFWPLGCRSVKELFGCALINVIFMAFGLMLLYWTITRELPDTFDLDNLLTNIAMQIEEIPRAVETCHAALLQGEMSVAQELCMPIGIDLVLLLLNLWLLLHYHRRWAKYVMVLMATMYLADVPCQLYVATFPAPAINHVEPTFALVYEELLVALNGINLKPGGSVAWVAYWGCATTSDVDACEKQFISTFEAGNVAVTFKSLDHFIPCYRDPPNPLKEQNFKCFKNIRIRVKNTESIPGWSRSVLQLSDVKVVNDKPNRIKKDQINRKAIVLKQGQQIDHDVSSPKDQNSRHAQPNEKVKIDTFSVIAFHQNKADKNEFGPKSFCKGAEVNNNGPQIKPKTRSEIIQSQTPKGVEVTFKASVKMPLIDVEMVKAATAIVATTVENLEEPKFEANKVLEGSLVDVKVDERQYHAPVIGSAIGQEATSTNEAVLLSSVINQDRTEISTMANKGRKRDENINAGAEINSPDTRSECMSTSGECNYNQKDMKEKSLDAVIVSRHPGSGYKRRPASRRRMNRQTKKALGSAAIGR